MESLGGLFLRFLRRHPAGRAGFILLAALGLLIFPASANAEISPYLREALRKFTPEIPREWAYTVMTERDGQRTTERYDASKPPEEQWHLLLMNGRPPTDDEVAKYFKYKAGQAPGATQATFKRTDIEPGSIELVRETADWGEFTCAFRDESAAADKMLAHLRLRLIVARHEPHVGMYVLELREPYSPVLGVKMRELVVEMTFAAPTDEHPSLPVSGSSHFVGRIFLVPLEETLRYAYSDFAHIP